MVSRVVRVRTIGGNVLHVRDGERSVQSAPAVIFGTDNSFLIYLFCCWHQVPKEVASEELSDDWTCADNTWDPSQNSCDFSQEYSNNHMVEVLKTQVCEHNGHVPNLIFYTLQVIPSVPCFSAWK
jgi:hypothetical protein